MNKVMMGLSGGIDSATLLYYLREQEFHPVTFSVDYAQRHLTEIDHATMIAEAAGASHTILDLTSVGVQIGKSSLTRVTLDVPEGHYEDETMRATVVPNRNMIFLSVLSAIALGSGEEYIAFGAHASDHAVYPDCRKEFVDAFTKAVNVGNYGTITVLAPFLRMTKRQVIELAVQLGVPIELTWSCYKGGKYHCGRCGTCVERKEAFFLAGLTDPVPYEDPDFWMQATGRS